MDVLEQYSLHLGLNVHALFFRWVYFISKCNALETNIEGEQKVNIQKGQFSLDPFCSIWIISGK